MELNGDTHPFRKSLFKKEMKILFLKFIHLLFSQMASKLLGHKVKFFWTQLLNKWNCWVFLLAYRCHEGDVKGESLGTSVLTILPLGELWRVMMKKAFWHRDPTLVVHSGETSSCLRGTCTHACYQIPLDLPLFQSLALYQLCREANCFSFTT